MHADLVVGEAVDICPVLEEQLSRVGPGEEGRVVEGGEVVVRTRLRQRRIGSQELSQTGDISERRGLEDVELCGLRQPARGLVVSAVERLHDLAHFRSFDRRRSLSTRPPV